MKTVLYVPLDDRPVNLDDVIALGQTTGINVITPNINDIRNRPDSQKTVSGNVVTNTSNPTFGNTSNIYQFILDNAATADGFIISVDMLVYGGLIGSRRLRSNPGGTYPNYDSTVTNLLDVIIQVKQSYPNKPLYVIDTIMRLATTAITEGLTFEASTESRTLMIKQRVAVTNFDQILNGYDNGVDGAIGPAQHFNKNYYYNTRRHKFKTNRYVLEMLARENYIDFLAIGVDDANRDGVQINEIRWMEGRINVWLGGEDGSNPDRGTILPDADGLGYSLLARMANHFHRNGAKPRFVRRYYGMHGSDIISGYEYMDVDTNILRHIDVIGGRVDPSNPYSFEMDIIVFTQTATPQQISNGVNRIQSNGNNRIPTIVIDLVEPGKADIAVTNALLANQFTGRILGYSAWNTPGNKIGISLGMGQARFAFLTTETQTSALNVAVNAHGSLLFKRFLKDFYYKRIDGVIDEVRGESRARCVYTNVKNHADQNMFLFNSTSDYDHLIAILRNRMQTATSELAAKTAFRAGVSGTSYNVLKINHPVWSFSPYISASLTYGNPQFIWGRAFEVTLNPAVTL